MHFEAGLVSHLVVPGVGLVANNAGTITAVFDSDGNLVSFELHGDRDGPILNYACTYLE